MKKGFTLVELLVVIILVAVLVAIALPRYMDAVYRGKVAACKQNISDLNTAIQAFQAKPLASKLVAHTDLPADPAALVSEGFMDEPPICPFTESGYVFDTDTDGVICFVDTTDHFTDWKNDTEHAD